MRSPVSGELLLLGGTEHRRQIPSQLDWSSSWSGVGTMASMRPRRPFITLSSFLRLTSIWEEYHEKGMQRPPEKEVPTFD